MAFFPHRQTQTQPDPNRLGTTSFNSVAGQFSLTNAPVNRQFYFITYP